MKKLTAKQREELKALSELAGSGIDLSDAPEITNFSYAEIGKFYKPIKKQIKPLDTITVINNHKLKNT